MAYKKGKDWKGNKDGRPKGAENKINADLKLVIKELLEKKSAHLETWLDKTAQTDPAKAVELFTKLSEFVLPKIRQINAEVYQPTEPKITDIKIHHVTHPVIDKCSLNKAKPMDSV